MSSLPPRLLVGTAGGIHRPEGPPLFVGREVTALAPRPVAGGWLALIEGSEVWRGDGDGTDWRLLASLGGVGLPGTCLAEDGRGALVGTAEAHLLRVGADGTAERLGAFDDAPDRSRWYTPWGGPPDTRSIAVSPFGDTYVGVHVGGILRAGEDLAGPWSPTIDIDSDVHQVLAGPDGELLVACALGFATSRDRGRTWEYTTAGLHGAYSRAVAEGADWVLLSASTGPSTDRAAVYRRPLTATGDQPFERCSAGLPEWFGANVDTGQLVAHGSEVALGTREGVVYRSADSGASWTVAAEGLPPVTAVGLG